MECYFSFNSMKKIRRKHKACRVDSLMVHGVAQHITGPFSPEYLADTVGFTPSETRHILSRSSYFISDGEHFCKRERLSSLYHGAMIGMEEGKVVDVSFSDIDKTDTPIEDALVNLCMKAAHKYGDCLTLIEMAIQLSVHEGYCTLQSIKRRLNTDIPIQDKLNHLVQEGFLKISMRDEEKRYRLTAKAGDIYRILFKSRAIA